MEGGQWRAAAWQWQMEMANGSPVRLAWPSRKPNWMEYFMHVMLYKGEAARKNVSGKTAKGF